MLKQFLNHIERHKLFNPSDKILLAVSGGLDSMAMLQLFKDAGFTAGVAHCNFQLRGGESAGDETLVKEACTKFEVPYHIIRFDTEEYAKKKGLSIEMAARELRYGFFYDLLRQHSYTYVATAHHFNDSIETVFLNLVRGTGMDGIKGIAVKQNSIVRPLLFSTREKIEEYANAMRLQWREDSSNTSDKHQRNIIRNQVIPLLKKINPNLEDGFKDTLDRISGVRELGNLALEEFKSDAVIAGDNQIRIKKEKLKSTVRPEVVLWELVKGKGFNYDQCKEIVLMDHQSGKIFYTHTHQLTIDRIDLIITPSGANSDTYVLIEKETKSVSSAKLVLDFKVVNKEHFILEKKTSIAQFDFDLIQYPLIWRKWKAGDQFIPLGMNLHKKLSDFLIDTKVPVPEKEEVTVLESRGKIAWVVGHRIDERFKVTANTNQVLVITLSR